MDFHIQADNPKGLNYDLLFHDPDKAVQTIKKIQFQGGVNIRVNGNVVPAELINALKA